MFTGWQDVANGCRVATMREEEEGGVMKREREIQKKSWSEGGGEWAVFMLAAHRRKWRCSDGACSECYISKIWLQPPV